MNGGTSVTLIAHSMGAPMCLHFLQTMDQKWKDKYISKLITLAGAWGGSVKAVKVYAVGEIYIFYGYEKILYLMKINLKFFLNECVWI